MNNRKYQKYNVDVCTIHNHISLIVNNSEINFNNSEKPNRSARSLYMFNINAGAGCTGSFIGRIYSCAIY